jgi:hypothetical protein
VTLLVVARRPVWVLASLSLATLATALYKSGLLGIPVCEASFGVGFKVNS